MPPLLGLRVRVLLPLGLRVGARPALGSRVGMRPVSGFDLELPDFVDADCVVAAFWSGPVDYLRGGML